MALASSTITDRAAKIIQDATNVRWPLAELVQWVNDGQREIILHRPDSNPRMNLCSMVAGSRQTLVGIGTYTPAKLLDVICVAVGTAGASYAATATRSSAVRLVEREVLDAQTFDWHYANTSSTPKHFIFDPRDPLAFYVYPALGAAPTTKLEVLFSAYPTDVTTAGEVLSVADVYGNALLDYVLYRCYSKDSEYAGNAQRAQFHFQSFATSMKLELKGTIQMGPTLSGSVWNPNTPKVPGSYAQSQPAKG